MDKAIKKVQKDVKKAEGHLVKLAKMDKKFDKKIKKAEMIVKKK